MKGKCATTMMMMPNGERNLILFTQEVSNFCKNATTLNNSTQTIRALARRVESNKMVNTAG